MTYGNSAIDLSSPPSFMLTWKSNLPLVIQSMKLHPLLMGLLLVSGIVHAVIPLAGVLASVGAAIAIAFIEYTIIKAVWSNIVDGAPNYIVTDTNVQWRMVGTQILVNILMFLLALLFIFPGAWFLIKSCLSLMATCLEDKAPVDAIKRSHELTNGHFLKTLGMCFGWPLAIIMSFALVAFVVMLIILLPAKMVSEQLGTILTIPIQATLTIALYALMLSMKPPLVHLYAFISRAGTHNTADDLSGVHQNRR